MLAPSTLDVAPIETLPDVIASAAPPPALVPELQVPPRWNLATRIAFRLCFLYFSLYVISTQMIGGLILLPVGNLPDLGDSAAMRALVSWVGAHLLRLDSPVPFVPSGSGDKMADWVQAFSLVLIAVPATAIWSVVDRRRPNYAGLNKWFTVFLRFSLGSTMVSYGSVKAIPLQMPAPGLTRLVEPFGNFSPMGVLWYSIGASRPYEIFCGLAELTGGILLFVPRLATLGALVCLADSIQIFMLNMTYDVPVKLFSFHLILISLVLLAPEASRLLNVLVFNRTAEPSTQPPLFRRRRAMAIAVAVQIVLGVYLVGMNFSSARQAWYRYGGGAPKSPLYGIWNIEEMSVDGVIRSPLINDWGRWKRAIFQSPTVMTLQRMDDSFVTHGAAIDMTAKTVALTRTATPGWKAQLAFQQPGPDQLILDGDLDGHTIHMKLRLFDRNKFLLVNRGFNWIQEAPFNR